MDPNVLASLKSFVAPLVGGDKGFGDYNAGANAYQAPPPKAPSFVQGLGNTAVKIGKAAVGLPGKFIGGIHQDLKTAGDYLHVIPEGIDALKTIAHLKNQQSVYDKQLAAGKLSQAQHAKYTANTTAQIHTLGQSQANKTVHALNPVVAAKGLGPAAIDVGSVLAGTPEIKAGLEATEGAGVAEKAATTFAKGVLGAGDSRIGNGVVNTVARPAIQLAKADLIGKPTLRTIPTIASEVKQGKFLPAAANTALLASGASEKGPVGNAISAGKKITAKVGSLTSDTHGLFDAVKLNNGQSVNEALDAFKASGASTKAVKTVENKLRVIQDLATQEHGSNPQAVAKLIGIHQPVGKAFQEQDLKGFVSNFDDLVKTRAQYQRTFAATGGITVGRLTPQEKSEIIGRLGSSPTPDKEFASLVEDGTIPNNPNLRGQIQDAIHSTDNPDDLVAKLNKFTASKPLVSTAEGLPRSKTGLFPTINKNAGTVKSAEQTAELVRGKEAPLGFIGRAATKVGLSPRATAPGEFTDALKANFATQLKGTPYESDTQKIFGAIRNLTSASRTAYDPRELTPSSIRAKLGPGYMMSDARTIKRAMITSYSKLPASIVGASNKGLNKIISAIPAEAYYLRAEQAGRFSFNPFFAAKQSIKTAALSLAESGGQWTKVKPETSRFLESKGFFSKFATDQGAADFFGANFEGDKTKQINRLQQNIVGGMAEAMAKAQGKSLDQIWQEGGPVKDGIEHAITMSLGYGKGGYLNSPLAKALNVVIFPSRFETKVAMAAAKAMAKQSPVAQVELIRGLANAASWYKSDQGKQWVKDNSQLAGMLDYFTPTHTLSSFLNFFGKGQHVADLGSVGGLPLGVITTIMQNQGVKLPGPLQQSIQINPATGTPYADKIPLTTKAKIQQGISDFVGSLFSYPGKTVGLPSKTDLIQGIAPGLKQAPGSFKYELPNGQADQGTNQQFTNSKSAPNLPKSTPVLPKFSSASYISRAQTTKPKKAKVPKFKSVPKSLQLNQ